VDTEERRDSRLHGNDKKVAGMTSKGRVGEGFAGMTKRGRETKSGGRNQREIPACAGMTKKGGDDKKGRG